MSGVTLRAIGARTGGGTDVAVRSAHAHEAAHGRTVIALDPAPRAGDRLRRATRECRLAIDAVEALLHDGGLVRADIAGPDTSLVYVTAAAYAASNLAFVEGDGRALHFPYTAPSAVPAEVSIEFGLHGPYAVLIGGAATTIDAIAHAATLLARGACRRAIVLAVETFAESADILERGGAVEAFPLVEAAVAGLFEMGDPRRAPQAPHAPRPGEAVPLRECFSDHGVTLACGPLLELAARRDECVIELRGTWRGREAVITVGVASEGLARRARKES